ncbi:MAG: efflux RND transporter permease subunit, partial [bacterium]
LFFLTGVEGRLLRPLGAAYVVSILSSLVVALTVTPAVASLLMQRRGPGVAQESFLARGLKRVYGPTLAWCLRHPWAVILPVVVATGAVVVLGLRTGRAFLPEFNEGSLTLSVVTVPGTSLKMSDELGRQVERVLHRHPEVVSTTRRTGRSELDEHTLGVYSGEIDVVLKMRDRSMPALLAALRKAIGKVPGVVVNIGQPISHRINHMLSGTRSAIAVKLFGPDLGELRQYGEQLRASISKVPGAVDVALEPMMRVAQVRVYPRSDVIGRFNMSSGDVVRAVGVALAGEVATELIDGSFRVPVRVSYAAQAMDSLDTLRALPIATPKGAVVPLRTLAEVRRATGPVSVNREGSQRRIVISANVAGGDLVGVLRRIQSTVAKIELPQGYRVAYGGQFKREAAARQILLWVGLVVIVGIFLLLYLAFGSTRATVLILANLPFALVGGLLGILLTDHIVSIASIVGFIALFGIATRNGILLISHYQHLQREEGESLAGAVYRGSLERLNPVLMTALTTGLAIVPLIVFGDQPGNELERPMALVIAGGLTSATALNMLVLPVLAKHFLKPTPNSVVQAPE